MKNLGWFVILVFLNTETHGALLAKFYPFGEHMGDLRLPRKDEGATNEIELQVPFVFYGEPFFSLFVNINGLVSFLTEIPYFFNAQFPLDYPIIAPFYSDVDISRSGNVWYRETSDLLILERAASDLRKNFASASKFAPRSVLVVTYDSVGSFKARSDKKNTYQLVMITDGEDSYVIFNYKDGGIQWLQGDGKTSGLSDALGQAGFVAADGRLYTIRGSGTDQVRNLDKLSNVGDPGVWMYRVGKVIPGQNIELPDGAKLHPAGGRLESFTEQSDCATGGATCHSSGVCRDYVDGFCCECLEDYYGNGINCIKKDEPTRVTGTLSGNINGIEIENADLHSYILSSEGRTYTAVSRVPRVVGYDLQSLTGIGEGIAWLFATPKEGVSNGFTLTGGAFNRSVEVNFPQSGQKAFVEQVFKGLDVFNNVALATTVSGSLPTVPIGSELEIDAFKEEFTKVEIGHLRARSNRAFKVKGQTLKTPYTVDTHIRYKECQHAPKNPQLDTLRLKVAENTFIRFDQAESIVRYSFSAKIGTLEEEDPCIKGREECGPNSQCIVDGDNFRCVCEQGYDYVFDPTVMTPVCLDMNECELGRSLCDVNAQCINSLGSYSCKCNPGFTGDGHYCSPQFSCRTAGCDPKATCEEVRGKVQCKCRAGYKGDGFFCTPDTRNGASDSCHIAKNCSPYAVCAPNPSGGYSCRCLQGYFGDGYSCRPERQGTKSANENRGHLYSPDLVLHIPEQTTHQPQPTLRPYYPSVDSLNKHKPESLKPECILDVCWCPENYQHNKETELCEISTGLEPKQYVDGNPSPRCIENRCTCPEGFFYNVLFNQCDPISEDLPLPVCVEGTCLCPFGYEYQQQEGNCLPLDLPDFDSSLKGGAPPCNIINNCHPNAQCLYFADRRENRCTCNPGFTGDGQNCQPVEVSCDRVDICHLNAECIFDDLQLRSVCVCKLGFIGDGLVCNPQDDCSAMEDCNLDAQCKFDSAQQRYVCKCNEGFQGDGFICNPIDDTSCNALNNCDPNAVCIFDSNQYKCQCKDGYEGDGYACRKIQLGCNVLHNCGRNADCAYEEYEEGFKCKCREGFEGDGFYCQAIINCLNDPGVCHPQATCERSLLNEYSAACICRPGFIGDGFACEETPDTEKNILLLNRGLSVLRMPVNSDFGNGFPIHVDQYMTAVGADIDCISGRYYWTDVGSRSIRSSKYDGSERRPVLSGGPIGSPEDVAVDWVSQNIYWTDSFNDIVAVAKSNGSKIKTVIEGQLVNPRGITVHIGMGLLFWSDWDRNNPKIEASGMDGSGRKILVSGKEVSLPNSLVIDYESENLCWADAGTHRIECIGVEGFGRRIVAGGIRYPFGLTIHAQSFYYTDWNDTLIHRVNAFTGAEESKRPPPPGGSGRLYGIIAVPDQCPSVSNVCLIGNGGCDDTHICLPNGKGGRTCACPDRDKKSPEGCSEYHY